MTQLSPWRRFVSAAFRATPVAWRGKARLAGWLLGTRGQVATTVLPTQWGVLSVPSIREAIAYFLMIDGVYEPESVRFLEQVLQPGDAFIDVGANVGFMSLVGARRVGETGRVLALEPSEKIYRFLDENIERNRLHNVIPKRVAVHDEDRALKEFYDAPVEHFGKGSLSPQYFAQPTLVPTRTLDSLLAEEAGLPPVRAVKVDVEGLEAAVFRGAGKLFGGKPAPLVLFEFQDWAESRASYPVGYAQDVLRGYGYRLAELSAWLRTKALLDRPMRSGEAMLVGVPPD